MTHIIKHLFHINAKRSEVFKAISTIEGLSSWWTEQTTGDASKGGMIQFRFGDHGGPDMKVTDIKPNESVSWECVESNHGWKGHTFTIRLDDNDGKTRVRFSHDGWKEADDFFGICNFSWALYLESLKHLCQTGVGKPFGSLTFRT